MLRCDNKYVVPLYCRAEMYAGRVAWCPLVTHVEYAPHDLLRLEKDGTDGRTDERTPDRYITLTARAGHRNDNVRTTQILVPRGERLLLVAGTRRGAICLDALRDAAVHRRMVR